MKQIYETPEMEIIFVEAEQGFATSGGLDGFTDKDGAWNEF